MARDIQLKKISYNKEEYNKVVDRNFNFFIQNQGVLDITLEEFFIAYENLYLDIPLTGINSHEYLISRSGELVNYEQDTQDITPLLDEIAELRQELLNANQQIIDLQNANITNGGN